MGTINMILLLMLIVMELGLHERFIRLEKAYDKDRFCEITSVKVRSLIRDNKNKDKRIKELISVLKGDRIE